MQIQRDQRAWLRGTAQETGGADGAGAQREMVKAVLASRAPPIDAPPGLGRMKPLRPTLQKLSNSDDIESYLDMFERVVRQQGWPEDIWATQLAGLLSEVLDAFSSVPTEAHDLQLHGFVRNFTKIHIQSRTTIFFYHTEA